MPPHAVPAAEAAGPSLPLRAAECPRCGSDQIRKRFFGGSKGGAIACFVLGGFLAFQELSRPGGDPLVLGATAIFVLAGIAALTGKRYRCFSCKKTFNSNVELDLPVQGELSRWALYSLFVCWLPIIGLPVAVSAVRDTSKRKGIVYGRTLAWISMAVSVLLHAFILFIIFVVIAVTLFGKK